jgi:hypothetical protein
MGRNNFFPRPTFFTRPTSPPGVGRCFDQCLRASARLPTLYVYF